MKRVFIFFIVINTVSYGMQQPPSVAASPRTDEAAIKHKLRLMINAKNLNRLLEEIIPTAEKCLPISKESSYDLNDNLKVTFKLAGHTAEVYKTNSLGKSARELGEYSGSIEDLKRLLTFIKKHPVID